MVGALGFISVMFIANSTNGTSKILLAGVTNLIDCDESVKSGVSANKLTFVF